MPEPRPFPGGNPNPAQALELSLLVDLEAHWENLKKAPPRTRETGFNLRELLAKQKAYETFRSRMAAYNKRYRPAYLAELLLNNPSRLGKWFRAMRDLYLQVEHDPRSHCPAHLLEKAYTWADRVALRLNLGRVSRSPPPSTIGAAIRDLESLVQWCDGLAVMTATSEVAKEDG